MLSETTKFSIRTEPKTPSPERPQHHRDRTISRGTRKSSSGPRRKIDRVSHVSGRLQSVLIRPHGFERDIRLLVDSGSSINIIKESHVPQTIPKEPFKKEFRMGNDRQTSGHKVIIEYLNKFHTFRVVSDVFPMPEDGILGLRFMREYTYSLSNESLKLNLHEHELFDDGIFLPPNQTRLIRIPVNKHEGHIGIFDNPHVPDSIFQIQNQTITIPISNDSSKPKKIKLHDIKLEYITTTIPEGKVYHITHGELYERLKLLKENSRLNHIEPTLRGNIEKIIHAYNDIFSLPGDPIPSSKLTQHKIVLTQDKIVNNRSYKPPECHKKEIQTQVHDMLTKN